MKLSIVARQTTWHTDQLVEEGKKKGIEVEIVNIVTLNGWQKTIDRLGEAVLWRSSSLDIPLGRSIMMRRIDAKRFLFNRSLAYENLLAHKLFQQKAINPLKTITGIPSYSFRGLVSLKTAIKEGWLRFPLVMKKNLSARGEGVDLIHSIEEIKISRAEFKEYVFQNFIKNDGDVRVLVLGGMALGAIKRTRTRANWKNNISQGATGVNASDLFETEDLRNKAMSIASKFGLQFCGVDFIFDQTAKIWRFMEINTVPQWQGFAAATGVNVAEKVIEYVMEMVKRREGKDLHELVRDYYDKFARLIRRSDEFHLYSRLWLVNKDTRAKEKLEVLRRWFLGEDDVDKRIAGLIGQDDERVIGITERKKYYRKYPNLLPWNNLLFWWLMAKIIYQVDLSSTLIKYFSKEDLIQLVKALKDDENAVRVLSSAALNLFYLVEIYTGEKVEVEFLWQIHIKENIGKSRGAIKQAFYFLSHLVVAGSFFYTRRIDDAIFIDAVERMEELLYRNYFMISLDMKFEFLVCADLVKYQTKLREIILDEAEKSLSPIGNFLVDTHNAYKHGFGHKLGRSEHRNALYLVACSKIK